MRAYARDAEEAVRAQSHVRAWARSGLLEPSQAASLGAELRTDLKRTNPTLRPVLAFFTSVIVAASVGFAFAFLKIRSNTESGTALILFGLACAVLSEVMVAKARLYRFGVEEALAMSAVALLALGAGAIVGGNKSAASLTVASAVAFVVYRRLGLVYSAIAAIICASAIPFQLDLAVWAQRLIAASTLGAVFIVSRMLHHRDGDDYPGDEYASIQAASWLGAYLVLNLRVFDIVSPLLSPASVPRAFYWSTCAIIWLMPIGGCRMAIREKDRQLLAVNVVMALATLASTKPYLGWSRASWDPMLLGGMMVGVALGVRRWLSQGPAGERAGFTSVPLLEVERDALRALGTISVALQPHAAVPSAPSGGFDGGRSGGGGAGAGF